MHRPRTPGPVASPSGLESPWQHFLRAVPDRDLELSSVWAHAAAHLQGLEMDPEQREKLGGDERKGNWEEG